MVHGVEDSRESHPEFHGVFKASTVEDLKKSYDSWSKTYDHGIESTLSGDNENHMTTEMIAVVRKTLPEDAPIHHLLDCGAGTGAAGPFLRELFPNLKSLIGFDLSTGMLKVAEERGCYTDLVQGCCPDMTAAAKACVAELFLYDLVFCAGTFTPNHAPSSTLAQLVPLVRKGGYICFSVRTYWYEDEESGFKSAQRKLEEEGKWTMLANEVRTYLPKQDVFANYFVYQRC
eukprot:GEMP01025488.1.p1 GENE.GEMP01025488.1~~GEMP01025488.1.p1  ORF type:complete len:231 (-),score=66.19 GEMP01025488.1:1626-2318(-)